MLEAIKAIYDKGKEAASKLFGMSSFDVAETPVFMKPLGLTGDKFTIRYGVISRHVGKDDAHTLTRQDWEKLPQAIQTPFAISEYYEDETQNKLKGYRLYTALQLADGSHVVVGVDVKNAGRNMEVNAITTVFGRRDEAGLTAKEKIVYKSETITPEQQSLLGEPNSRQYPAERESSDGKDTKKSAESQSQVSEKIEDVGEQLVGARKDMLKELAKTMENVTLHDLIALPFSKVFKRPDFKKALESSALREKDVQFAEAIIAGFLNYKKPKAGTGGDRLAKYRTGKSLVEEWAERTYSSIKTLREFINDDVENRDELIDILTRVKTVDEENAKAKLKELERLNPHHQFNGRSYTINPIAFFYDVLSRIDYTPGEKVNFPLTKIEPNSDYSSYKMYDKSGNRISHGTIRTYEDAVNEAVYLIRYVNADPNLSHPESRYRYVGVEPIYEKTGWTVTTTPTMSSSRFEDHRFNTKEEAEVFVKEFMQSHPKGWTSIPKEALNRVGYKGYVAEFVDPLTSEKIRLGITYSSLEEAREKFESDHDKLDEAVNKKIAEAAGKKGAPKSRLEIVYYVDGADSKLYYGIKLAGFNRNDPFNTLPYYFADKIKTKSEAIELLNKHKEEWEAKAKEIIDMRNNFVYFDGENQSRIGEDYRKGKDVSAEEFLHTFGFRGVQFGNWANQADRQAAINNAYDSFMDLAKVLDVSPRALGLNGELGIAFGSRGSGQANAHYELDTVVINLTKTRGAGSLAHEWWHALDNYFARQGGMNSGMATANKVDGIRKEMRDAFNALSKNVEKSDYHKRSKAKGSYWGSIEEETARLFGEWIVDEMSKSNERNHFLSRGIGNAEQRYARMSYQIYMKNATRRGDKVMSFEDFLKTRDALNGFVYPTRTELDQLGNDIRTLFDVVQEKVDEETGNVTLFNIGEDIASPMTEAQRDAFDAVREMLEQAGIPVELLTDEQMDALAEMAGVTIEAKRKSAVETALPGDESPFKGTVVSSTDGAKVLNNLRNLAKEYQEKGERAKTFIGDVATALGARQHGSGSQYATFETVNGHTVTIRLANHNASTANFDNAGRDNGISIVISRKPNNGVNNDGNAHIVEFCYNDKKLQNADGKPLAQIIRSIEQALYSGEYKDTTGLAEREEVNAADVPRLMTVYHGSGAVFDAFDHSHMGEGEGAQIYGWGSYVTEVEGIGRTYADAMKRNNNDTLFFKGKPINYELITLSNGKRVEPPEHTAYGALHSIYGQTLAGAKREMEKLRDGVADEVLKDYYRQVLKILRSAKKSDFEYRTSLYTVEIPDDTGENYLDWSDNVEENERGRVVEALSEIESEDVDTDYFMDMLESYEDSYNLTGEGLYKLLEKYAFKDARKTSEFLSSIGYTGVKYPAEYRRGGRKDGAKNYVIFKDSDLKITNRVSFLKDGRGVVYGAAMNGRIYLNGSRLNPNTPIHEYTHLWDESCMKNNPELWKVGVELMKGTSLWNEVKNDPNYANLKTDDEIASEVHARLTGKDGAALLERLAREAREAKGVFEVAEKISLIERLKRWLSDFWYWVKDTQTPWSKEEAARVTLEDFINMPIADLAKGTKLNQEAAGNARFQFIGEEGASRLDAAEEATTRLDNLGVAREMESAFNEKKARIEKLRRSKPVEITGEEIEPSDDLKQYKKNALEYGKKLQGSYTNNDTGTTIQLQRGRRNGGIHEVLQHDYKDKEHLQSIAAIPQIIEQGIFIESERNTDKAKNPDVTEYQYYVCGLKIGGEDYTVRSVIAIDRNGNRYYDHKLTHIEKGKLLDLVEGQAAENGFGTTPGTKPTTNGISTVAESNPSVTASKDTKLLHLLQADDRENARRIKLATGWERGADGKWRYEIPDINIKKGLEAPERDFKLIPLFVLVDSEELFAAYPELKEVVVLYKELPAGTDGSYSPAIKSMSLPATITLSSKYLKVDNPAWLERKAEIERHPLLRRWLDALYSGDIESTDKAEEEVMKDPVWKEYNDFLMGKEGIPASIKGYGGKEDLVHEIQHAIQHIEGFAQGGNAKVAERYVGHVDGLDRYIRRELSKFEGNPDWDAALDEVRTRTEAYKDSHGIRRTSDVPESVLNGIEEDVANKYPVYRAFLQRSEELSRMRREEERKPKTASEAYRRLSGEVEARNASRRMELSEEERRASLASETEDVAREDQLFLQEALGVSMSMGDKPGTFKERQKKAVANKGTVMPGLNDALVKVVNVARHDFTGTGKQAIEKAKKWALDNLIGNHTAHQSGNEFDYIIDEDAVKKFLSSSSTTNSDNLGVHLSVLKELPKVIDESIEVEEHPDYKKINRIRKIENGIGEQNLLVHRMYGAINIDGNIYRVKTTIHEHYDKFNRPHDYRVTKVELLISGSPTSDALSNSTNEDKPSIELETYPVAKLLQNVEKSYDKGKKLLDESKLADEEDLLYRTSDEIEAEYPHWLEGTTTDSGKHTTQVEGTRKTYNKVGDWIEANLGKEAEILDASSGLGYGTADLRERGFRIEDVEPYQSEERKAKADGTWLKAPNGEPTNLTEKQWVQVRTRAFKRWFGDWELKFKQIRLVTADIAHGFDSFDAARAWAKQHIVRTYSNQETGGKGEIRISNAAVEKYTSQSAVDKSDSKDVHLAVLRALPQVIRESVDAEQHPDYMKVDGVRSPKNGINPNVTVHRLYGAVEIGGQVIG